jgi:phosphoglycolate phosphatase
LSDVGVIFDLDGTLLDSANQIIPAVHETRLKYNLPTLASNEIFQLIGKPARDLFENKYNSIENSLLLEIIEYFRKILENKYMKESILFPGAKNLILLLLDSGLKIGIATSKPTYLAASAIHKSALNQLPISIQGTDDFPAKPDPSVILKCISSLKTTINLMVGDRTEDMEAGKRANCSTIGLTQSSHSKNDLILAGADLVLPRLSSITPSLINEILGKK